MTTKRDFIRNIRQRPEKKTPKTQEPPSQSISVPKRLVSSPITDIDPGDPIINYFLKEPYAQKVDNILLDSPTLDLMKSTGIKLTAPLISQGELLGLLNLGDHTNQRTYSDEDQKTLNELALQIAPVFHMAQQAQEQEVHARERERLTHELQVARLIQQTLLPQELPDLPGWQLTTYYQPAREIGGDFYDFLKLPDEHLGIIIGDVTDKGIPAALVMATIRSILRSVAYNTISPGKVLKKANNLLYPDIPERMFVTCFFGVLDIRNGHLVYANAGHDLPYRSTHNQVIELRATGMPLGLMPNMAYEERSMQLQPGDHIVFYSDGLVEAHNPEREMFGLPRLAQILSSYQGHANLIDLLLGELQSFAGPRWVQEDDLTLVTLHYLPNPNESTLLFPSPVAALGKQLSSLDGRQVLYSWSLPSEPGNERLAIEQLEEVIKTLQLPRDTIERLKTAVAETTMNAMEHGNGYDPELPVMFQVLSTQTTLTVRISDRGGQKELPTYEAPDLEAKLAGLQTPRGWGMFLIRSMVDEMNEYVHNSTHTIELTLHLKGDTHE